MARKPTTSQDDGAQPPSGEAAAQDVVTATATPEAGNIAAGPHTEGANDPANAGEAPMQAPEADANSRRLPGQPGGEGTPLPANEKNAGPGVGGGEGDPPRRWFGVTSAIDHDGSRYGAGDQIALTPSEFDPLAKAGVLVERDWDQGD